MKKTELKVIGLSYGQSQLGSFVVVLGDTKTKSKLPVIIKTSDALYIELKLQNIESKRPMSHDIIKNITDCLGADIQEVVVVNVVEGTFYCKAVLSNMIDQFEIECGVGDAISLSLLYGCPIYCNREVVRIHGFEMEDDGSITEEQHEKNHRDRDYSQSLTPESLQKMLDKALENEEYEIASQLRDRIKELKKEEENGN
jgi:bifunctional DNase/RNase